MLSSKFVQYKGRASKWSEEAFATKKFKNTLPWTYNISDLQNKDIVATFQEKELQKTY